MGRSPLWLPTEIARLASELRERATAIASALTERVVEAASEHLLDRDPFELVIYRGYGTATRARIRGRAMESKGVTAPATTDSRWLNILNSYRRFESDPLALARVSVTFGGITREVEADDEGFFEAAIELATPASPDVTWHSTNARLLAPLREDQPEVRATGAILTPTTRAAFAVISDIDDTVLQSKVTSFVQSVRTVALGNARTRLPFAGVGAFYQALVAGSGGNAENPVFYVSSSPWNLYDVIMQFLEFQGIPVGPVLLRDWDLHRGAFSPDRHHSHKGAAIREILETYRMLPVILMGDSGQQDPEIYRAIVGEYPDRVLAVYIRNVSQRPGRSASIRALAEEIRAARSTLILADDTIAAAMHAAEHGWIDADALSAIAADKRADEGTSGSKVAASRETAEPPQAPTVVVDADGGDGRERTVSDRRRMVRR